MPIVKRVLTDAAVKRIVPPKEGRTDCWDAALPSFGLRVFASGIKSWVVMQRVHGKLRRITLGRYPTMSLRRARERAAEEIDKAHAGIDVNYEKRKARAEHNVRRVVELTTGWPAGSFGALAETYIARACSRLARGRDVESVIRRELLPYWGDRPADELRKRDLYVLTDAIADSGRPSAANLLQRTVRRMYYWAEGRDMVDVSPFSKMEPAAVNVLRGRVISDEEICRLWSAWDEMAFPFGQIMKLLLVTGQRRSEVGGMTWSEIDFDRSTWTIPRERSKSDRVHLVPLSSLAVEILEEVPRFDDGYVFPTRTGEREVSGFSKAKLRADRLSGINEPWRVHDLRRTCRTGLAKLQIPEIVAERVINHAPRGLIAIYNIHDYLDERGRALDAWSRYLESIIRPSPDERVISISAARVEA